MISDLVEFINNLTTIYSVPELRIPLLFVVLFVGAGGLLLGRLFWRSKNRGVPLVDPGNGGPELSDCREELEKQKEEKTRLREEMDANQQTLDAMLNHEGQIWRLYPPSWPDGYEFPAQASRAKIVVVANNKGGVGKTTLVIYLAAYFACQGKRVLAIDLDYQGSLTRAMLAIGSVTIPPQQAHRLSYVNQLLSENGPKPWTPEVLNKQLDGVHLITSDQTLEAHETSLQLHWLAQRGEPDVRFFLSRVLLGDDVQGAKTDDAVQNAKPVYDVVLIDAPPRLSVGAVNALVAGTHLLVPTKLDDVSAETVGGYLKLVNDLRAGEQPLNPGIELAGVVGTMTLNRALDKELTLDERGAVAIIKSGLERWRGNHHIFKADIQDRETIRKTAGKKLVSTGVAPEMFDSLGAELAARIGLG